MLPTLSVRSSAFYVHSSEQEQRQHSEPERRTRQRSRLLVLPSVRGSVDGVRLQAPARTASIERTAATRWSLLNSLAARTSSDDLSAAQAKLEDVEYTSCVPSPQLNITLMLSVTR